MESSVQKKMEEISLLIQKARGHEAKILIEKLSRASIPPEALPKLAALARRAQLPHLALKLLHPIVRPGKTPIRKATEQDKAEYAVTLLRVGAVSEANELLKQVSSASVPEVLLFQAMSHMKVWDYAGAIPLLRQYLTLSLSDYERVTGTLNLAASLLFTKRFVEARALLNSCINESTINKYSLLKANSIRLLGVLECLCGDFESSLFFLNQAHTLLKPLGGMDQFLTQKWMYIAEYLRAQGDLRATLNLMSFRERAKKNRQWETVRDIDYYILSVTKDENLFQFLYFGSAPAAFKRRLQELCPQFVVPPSYRRNFPEHSSQTSRVCDLFSKEISSPLKEGKSLHRLLCALTSDFYAPLNVIDLYDKVFAGEYYAHGISEYRVRQAVKKLRKWLAVYFPGVIIVHQEGGYRLHSEKHCALFLSSTLQVQDTQQLRIDRIFSQLPIQFTVSDAAGVLGLQERATQKMLAKAIEAGLVIKTGQSRATKYQRSAKISA